MMTAETLIAMLHEVDQKAIISAGFPGINGHANSFDGTIYEGKDEEGNKVIVFGMDESTVTADEMDLTEIL